MPFVAHIGVVPTAETLQAAMMGLVALNRIIIVAKRIPALYSTGVVWRREAPGAESWDTADKALARGYSDCEDLAAWRAAELQLEGERAKAIAVQTGVGRWHAVVEREDRRIEDPSRITLALAKRRMTKAWR